MSTTYNLKLDIAGRLSADDYFSDVDVLALKPKDLLSELLNRLNRLGLSVVVDVVDIECEIRNISPAVQSTFTILVLVCENRLLNATGKTGEDVAEHALTLLNGYFANPICNSPLYIAEPFGPQPIGNSDADRNKFIWPMYFKVVGLITDNRTKVANVSISPISGAVPQTVTLSCPTAEASIYYTVDETYPHSGNTTATLYSAPITISQACVMRVCAHKTGYIASNTASATYT